MASDDASSLSIAEAIRVLRAEIYAGRWDEGGKLPSRARLAHDYEISPESASIVLRTLRDEGLVRLVQGSGTFALPRHRYSVTITARYSGDDPARVAQACGKLPLSTEAGGPAVRAAAAEPGPDPAEMAVRLAMESPDQGHALVRALLVVRAAVKGVPGWDVTSARAEVEPDVQ